MGTLEARLTIGRVDGSQEYLFGSVADAAIGADSSIYVLDVQGPVVRHYDKRGTYVGNIGRAGRGPGEYDQPSTLAVTRDGRLLVGEARSGVITVYSSDGSYEQRWDLGEPIDEPLLSDDSGHVYVRLLGRRQEMFRWASGFQRTDSLPNSIEVIRTPAFDRGIVRMSRNGEVVGRIPPPPAVPDIAPYFEDANGRIYYGFDFIPQDWWAFNPPSTYLTGTSDKYLIEIRSAAGRRAQEEEAELIATIRRPSEAIRLSAVERRMVQRQMDWSLPRCSTCSQRGKFEPPAVKPAYFRVMIADDGTIWVMRHAQSEEFREESGAGVISRETETRFDVFQPSGAYIGSLVGPAGIAPLAIQSNTVLALMKDRLGVDRVARLSASWKRP